LLEALEDGGAEFGGAGEFIAVAEDGAEVFAEDGAVEEFGVLEFLGDGVVFEAVVEPFAPFFVRGGVGDEGPVFFFGGVLAEGHGDWEDRGAVAWSAILESGRSR